MVKRRNTFYARKFLARTQREYAETEAFVEGLLEVYEATWEELELYLSENYLTIVEEYANVPPIAGKEGLSLPNIQQLAIYETVQRQIVAESLKLLQRQNDLVIPYMERAIEKGYLSRAYDYATELDELSSYFFFNPDIVEQIMQRKWFGGNYYTRSVANNEKLASAIDEILAFNATRGFPLEYMMLQLREKFDWLGKGRAKTLIQSEVGYVLEQANYQVMEDTGLEKYMYLATLEINTCPICRGLDMTIHLLSKAEVGKNYPLMHGNCRCTAIGYIEGAPIKQRWYRDPVTGKGKIGNAISYDEWFKQYVIRKRAD